MALDLYLLLGAYDICNLVHITFSRKQLYKTRYKQDLKLAANGATPEQCQTFGAHFEKVIGKKSNMQPMFEKSIFFSSSKTDVSAADIVHCHLRRHAALFVSMRIFFFAVTL